MRTDPPDGDRIKKRNDIAGEIVDLVTRNRLLRVAETTLIEDKLWD